ncbi:MAG: hypothetical protein WBB43_23230 [Limnoraphis sp.]
MTKLKCKLGFDCAAMMQQPGLHPKNCLNSETCGLVYSASDDEEFELFVGSETVRINRREAAIMMLMNRACPQTLESLGILGEFSNIENALSELQNTAETFTQTHYIAPTGVEVHRYNVKSNWSGLTYWYNKFTAKTPIFSPAEKTENVRVIHLSKDDDPRNTEGRLGIERRNRLLEVKTKLKQALQTLEEAGAILQELEDRGRSS